MVYDAVLKVAPDEVPLVGYVLWGEIHNDRKLRFSDGHFVHTSKILAVNVNADGVFISTMNSIYRVEEIV
jgi:hypothetical protein